MLCHTLTLNSNTQTFVVKAMIAYKQKAHFIPLYPAVCNTPNGSFFFRWLKPTVNKTTRLFINS